MKKIIFSLLFFFVLSSYAFAQLDGIDLNKYKLTDFRYGRLSTDLSLNSYYNKSDNHIKDGNFSDFSNTSKQKALGSFLNLGYYLNVSNRKYIGTHSIYGNFSHAIMNTSSFGTTSPDNKDEEKQNTYQLNISTSNLFYFNEKQYFGIILNSYSQQMNDIRESMSNNNLESKYTNIFFYSNNRLSLQIGSGRIENVVDARQAIYILDELNKKNRLTHQPTQDETFEFADFITKVLNKRIIDSREKRIEEHTLVDSFLVSKGLISKQDGKYFGILNDNWIYARTQSWLTGSKLYFGIISQFNYNHQFHNELYNYYPENNKRYTYESMNKNIGLEAGYVSNWIKGLKWINSFNCNLSVIIDHFDPYNSAYPFSESNDKLTSLKSNIGYSLSFVPNTRTSITSSTAVLYRFSKNEDAEKMTSVSPRTRIACNYYVSQKLQLNTYAECSYSYFVNKYELRTRSDKNIFFGFGASLIYYFF